MKTTNINLSLNVPVAGLVTSSELTTKINFTAWSALSVLNAITKTFREHLDYLNGGKNLPIETRTIDELHNLLNVAVGMVEWIPDMAQELERIADGRNPNKFTEHAGEEKKGKVWQPEKVLDLSNLPENLDITTHFCRVFTAQEFAKVINDQNLPKDFKQILDAYCAEVKQ